MAISVKWDIFRVARSTHLRHWLGRLFEEPVCRREEGEMVTFVCVDQGSNYSICGLRAEKSSVALRCVVYLQLSWLYCGLGADGRMDK